MSKATVTRTINPLHFEDLEPHRFEDLVRQLTYDHRDWYKIEATGRSGADEGMDIRAWEKALVASNEDENGHSEGENLIEGNLWVVQCKREKQLGPTKVKQIVSELGNKSVHGYILAAPVNFSRKSYDAFRESIREKGITECYLWGKAELEDMLLMPKNDRILFTFFGISLVAKRRVQTSEVKFKINTKNKLYRVLGDDFHGELPTRSVLLRDIYDTNYPYKDRYMDFELQPRWEEVLAYRYQPQGLLLRLRRYYGYFDPERNEFDFTNKVDLLPKQSRYEKRDQDSHMERQSVEDFFIHLPRKQQAMIELVGLVAWEDILVIDDKGDSIFQCPHLFVDSKNGHSLVTHKRYVIVQGKDQILMEQEFKRKVIFPKKFPTIQKPKPSRTKSFNLEDETKQQILKDHIHEINLYGLDNKYRSLKKRDVVPVLGVTIEEEPLYLEISHKYSSKVRELVAESEYSVTRSVIEKQAGRDVKDSERVDVLECRRIYKWQLG